MSAIEGIGIGLRHELAKELLEQTPDSIRWLEIHPENYAVRGGLFQDNLERAAERWPIVPHGLTLGFGALAPFEASYVALLRSFLRKLDAPWYSDHLCFAQVDGTHLHDLLPLPFREDAIEVAVQRVRELRDGLEIPVAIENVSFYADPAERAMDEASFVIEVLERADCKLLLDVNNVYVNSRNHGFDARAYLDRIPPERVVQIHVAGHFTRPDGLIIDTHGEAICDDVYELLGHALERLGPVPVLLERDTNMPALADVLAEVDRLSAIYERSVGIFRERRQPAREATAR